MPDQPQRSVRSPLPVIASEEAPVALVAVGREVELRLGLISQRLNQPRTAGSLAVGGGAVGNSPVFLDHRNEAIPARKTAGEGCEAAGPVDARQGAGVDRLPRSIGQGRITEIALAGRAAVDVDRPGQRPRLDPAGAPRHADTVDRIWVQRGEGDPSAEGVGLGDAVQGQRHPASGVAAKAAQGQPLAGRMGRTRIRPAEAGEAGDVAKHILHAA